MTIPWSKEKTLGILREIAIVPVVRVASPEEAFHAVEGVVSGGIPIAEITMTIPHALHVMESVSERYGGNVLLGAGTIVDAETCRSALLAGAEFIVSPVLDRLVVETAHRYGKVCIPGALTATEVLTAWQSGADLVKIFHCGLMGGPQYVRALKGPFPNIDFLPTGGVNLETAPEYIKAGATAVGVGEGILDREALRQGKIDVIAANARKFLRALKSDEHLRMATTMERQ